MDSMGSSLDFGKSPDFNESPPSFWKTNIFNSTAVINEYNSSGEKKVFSNNFFEKIKPIVKSLKDSAKVKKKEYKDQATSMEKSPKGSELFRRNEGKKID
jgi:hypothetical protein